MPSLIIGVFSLIGVFCAKLADGLDDGGSSVDWDKVCNVLLVVSAICAISFVIGLCL
jgi:hypothetical protein